MANWLSRATEGFRKPPPPAPEPYSIRCDCGGMVNGVRLANPQRPSCPTCGRQIFVLPANVYPVTIRPKKPAPPAATESMSPSITAPAPAPANPARGRPAVPEVPPAVKPTGILIESRSRILTPFRLIVAAITAVAVITAWGLWHRHRVESAKANVLAANEAGMKALREREFGVAARELTRARDAVDILRRKDPEANTIRRYCREAIAGHGLASSSIFDVLADYAADSHRGRSRFGTLHRDSWLLLDATVINPEAAGQPCVVDMPLLLDGMTFRVEIDSNLIKTAAAKAGNPARVIFAAQMKEIRSPSAKDPDAVLALNGQTAFLWTDMETYVSLGYGETRPEDLQITRDLLSSQLEQMEAAK